MATYRKYLDSDYNGTALQNIAEKIECEVVARQNCSNDAFLGQYDAEIERLEGELAKIEASEFTQGKNLYK